MQCRLREQPGRHSTPAGLALPTGTQCNHWDFLPGGGNFTINVSAEDAIIVFTPQTHEEN